MLPVWNNMPSRATYSYVSKARGHSHSQEQGLVSGEFVMDPETDDRHDLIMAACLSRIVCRKLEVEAYAHLQRKLNAGFIPDADMLPFLRLLGHILLTLRWRVSWWEEIGGGGGSSGDTAPDAEKKGFEERVQSLCRVLYFYYCSLRRRLPAWTNSRELEGMISEYPDAGKVFDDFPGVESVEGFEEWMAKGKSLIRTAGVAERVEKIKVVS